MTYFHWLRNLMYISADLDGGHLNNLNSETIDLEYALWRWVNDRR